MSDLTKEDKLSILKRLVKRVKDWRTEELDEVKKPAERIQRPLS